MTPSVAFRPCFLEADVIPFFLNHSPALSISPYTACSAFLQSAIPAPVLLRNSPTCFAPTLKLGSGYSSSDLAPSSFLGSSFLGSSFLGSSFWAPVCLATSSAKFSDFFSNPSPKLNRSKRRT